jgi:hypothetical protein
LEREREDRVNSMDQRRFAKGREREGDNIFIAGEIGYFLGFALKGEGDLFPNRFGSLRKVG